MATNQTARHLSRTAPTVLVANLLGLCGLAGVAASLGALAGTWWVSVLVAGAELVGLAYVAHTHIEAAEQPQPVPEAQVPGPRRQGRAA